LLQSLLKAFINLYEYLDESWGVLFSHAQDFTPVATTELGVIAKLQGELEKCNTKVIAVSVDPIESHERWVPDINEIQGTKVNFPIIAPPPRRGGPRREGCL
jgi:thioredoxin-dependent peroxiredoxin